MPLYDFKNEKTGEIRSILFGMNDKKEYFGENGEEIWKRLFSSPNMGIDTKINPFSEKDFLKKTKDVKTYGKAIEISKEMSDMRAEKSGGVDKKLVEAEKKFYKPKKQ